MTLWYNQNPKIDIRTINLGSFMKAVEKELKAGNYITIGVEERPYFTPNKGAGRRTMSSSTRGTTSISLIAAGHEFGTSRQPRRSFLEKSARRFVKSDLQKIVKKDYTYVKSFLKALTVKLYDTIIECFLTSGWGSWKHLSETYKKRTGRTDPPLIDTGQLMSAVYAQFEGFTVSGKQVGGFMQSEFYNIEDFEKEKHNSDIVKAGLNEAEKFKAQLPREMLVNMLYKKKKEELGQIGFLSWVADNEQDIDVMTSKEIIKRFGI